MISAAEMAAWIEDLAQIGQHPDGPGMWRRPYTEDDERALAWVRQRAEAAGLSWRRDAIGNVIARIEGRDPAAKAVATGSHLDTVKSGGKYDGALGVLTGLAAIADVVARRGQPDRPLELFIFESEEGNRFRGTFGSTAWVDGYTEAIFAQYIDADGISAADAMRSVGLDPARLPVPPRDDLGAFIELHIEQGANLEREGIRVGVVSAIVTGRRIRAAFTGQPGHAGTTPMAGRRDPLQGAAELVLGATRLVEAVGAPAVITCGQFTPLPGAPNVIPARVDLTLDNRDADRDRLDATTERLHALAREIAERRDLGLEWQAATGAGPGPMDPGLRDVLRQSAAAAGISWRDIYSGAGHDAGVIARHYPAAMLFVPSQHGYSHRPDEFTPIESVMDGVRVLAGALERLAYS